MRHNSNSRIGFLNLCYQKKYFIFFLVFLIFVFLINFKIFTLSTTTKNISSEELYKENIKNILVEHTHKPFTPNKEVIIATETMDKIQLVKQIISTNKLVIFSKTTCPYCSKVKALFSSSFPSVKPFVVELNIEKEGSELQSALSQVSNSRTVPQVFINGQFYGGCDDTHKLFKDGKLTQLLKDAGLL